MKPRIIIVITGDHLKALVVFSNKMLALEVVELFATANIPPLEDLAEIAVLSAAITGAATAVVVGAGAGAAVIKKPC
jgi:hypothetical protein